MTAVTQAAFRAALTDPRQPEPKGLTDPQGRPAGARFNVYRNNVMASLSKALAEAFPALEALLGAQNFSVLAREFVRSHPPTSPLMARYGEELPAFLHAFPHTKGTAYLPDVARLEQAMRQSYHAADTTPADLTALAALDAQHIAQTRLSLSPAMQLVTSPWPILQIRAFALGHGPKPDMCAQDVLILRPEFDPTPHALPPGGAVAVTALMQGASLEDAATRATKHVPAFDLQPVLTLLIAGRSVTALHFPTT